MSRFHEKSFPGESAGYRETRDQLLQAELDLRQQVEAVATLRRKLPLGGELKENYVFEESTGGAVRDISFSDLLAPGKDSLIVYNYMFAPDWEKPCPMCTSVLDGFNGNAAYVNERAAVAVVARAPVERLRAWGDERGWSNLRLLSSAKNTFNADYNAQFPSEYGDDHPVLHTFVRRADKIHHFWSSEVLYAKVDGQPRHVDLVWPLWNLLDLTPEGRGSDWYPAYQK